MDACFCREDKKNHEANHSLKLRLAEIKFISLIISVVLVDQLSKWWIMVKFLPFETRVVVPGFFNLVHVTNTGAAFGILAGDHVWWRQFLFVAVSLTALIVIFATYRHVKTKDRIYVYAMGLIAGGAVGNLIDRLRFGAVVDFLDFYIKSYHWPAFNVADSAISVGVGLFLLAALLGKEFLENNK